MLRPIVVLGFAGASLSAQIPRQPTLGTRSTRVIERDGLRFKDLNHNGRLDPYEDWRRTPTVRARDLVGRMTIDEKAGLMMHGTARSSGRMGGMGAGTEYDSAAISALVRDAHVNSFITRLRGDPTSLAEQHNKLQSIAEATRLGIPLTISSDPRHHFQYVLGASVQSGQFSQWPEPLGFGALRDTALMRRFGDIARREYRAVGIHMTLSPQADLATEPRWSRINGTFGEDAQVVQPLVRAYVEGFQGSPRGVDSGGVLAVVKHWVGYGAAKRGFDSHNYYGRYASFSGDDLQYHIAPFLGAFEVRVAGVMPTYSILEGATLRGQPVEQVGAGFSHQLLSELLRHRFGFQGVILTDWAVTNDCVTVCRDGSPEGSRPSFQSVGMPWGVEDASMDARFARAVRAGVDQFGGTERADVVARLARTGAIPVRRLDESALRVLRQKLELGLFENPYVDPAKAASIVGSEALQAEATRAQRRSLVLLENRAMLLPIDLRGKRVFLHQINPEIASEYGFTVVSDLAQADVAIVRAAAPFQTLHPQYVFGAMQHEGDLGFREGDEELETIKRISAAVPTILTVYLDRPAILTAVKDRVSALVANFGVSDAALLDVLTGRARPEGKLPFELPSSMADVEAQRSDRPHDTARPLYPIGFGRSY